ncbi:MAG: hypothetical protein ABIP65_07515 [Vicinamibacterales bacterium]
MYTAVLMIHSWLRWAVLVAGLLAVARAATAGGRPWTPADDRSTRWFTIALDVQVLLGLLLYFVLSPFTREAMGDFGAAMKTSGLRFWAVEHTFGMIIGAALAHVGAVRIRKAPMPRKHRLAVIFFGLALLVILASIPWPGTAAGRPLFRW